MAPASSAPTEADRLEAERLLNEIAARLPGAVGMSAAVRQVAADQLRRAESDRAAEAETLRRDADSQRTKAREAADEWAVATAQQSSEALWRFAGELAPGAAGEPWLKASDWRPSGQPSRHLRFGDLGTASEPAPALAPFLMRRGWTIEAGSSQDALDLVRATLLRLVGLVPLKQLRLLTYDPRTSGALGVLAPLRAANASSFPSPAIDPDGLLALLKDCQSTAARHAEQIHANQASDLFELWEKLGIPEGTVTVLTLLDYPLGITEEANHLLTRLAETGPARGVHLLVQPSETIQPAERVEPAALLRQLSRLRIQDGRIANSVLPSTVPVHRSAVPEPAVVAALIQRAADASASDTGPTVLLSQVLAADAAQPWTGDSSHGLDLPIGLRGRDPLTLSFRTANPPTAHMLLGGKTGYGKSNVLLDIVYAAATRYSPDELRLWLLDFKQGLEFQAFAPDASGKNWLPHVEVLSLESSKAFGLAVLRHALAEVERRAELFKSVGGKVGSLGEYRRASGRTQPRILLIVDEFQMLFDGDDEDTDEAVRALDVLARQGRVFGIHLLMASQSMSGISGFRTRGEAILGQFLLRASLFNDAQESQAIFTMHNTAAADLTYRGEMILNRNGGTDPERYNERVLAAYAEPAFTAEVQRALWQRDHAAPPMVFLGRDFAAAPAEVARLCAARPSGSLRLLLGRPIAITDRPTVIDLHDDVDQAVAVVGGGDDLWQATLTALTATALQNRVAGLRVVVLDGAGLDERADSPLAQVLEQAREQGVDVQVVPRREVTAHLLEVVRPELADPAPLAPTLYLGLGLQRVSDLGRQVAPDPDDPFTTIAGSDVLRELARDGATRSQFLIGSWTNVRALREHLGHDFAGVGVFAALRLGADDLRDLAGFNAHVDGHPRVLLVDRREDVPPTVVVPFTVGGWTA